MKRLRLIWEFYRFQILSVFLLILLMAVSAFIAAYTMGQFQYIRFSNRLVETANMDNGYYIMPSMSHSPASMTAMQEWLEEKIAYLQKHPSVDKVVYTREVNPIQYKDNGVTIILYSKDLLDAFPLIKEQQYGAVEADSFSCILGSRLFEDTDGSDTLSLLIPGKSPQTFQPTIAGRLKYPFYHFSLGTSSTTMTGNLLFREGPIIIMPETPENVSYFKEYASASIGSNFFVSFLPSVSYEQQQEVLESLTDTAGIVSMEDIIGNTQKLSISQIKQRLPPTLFLLFISSMCYLSISLLLLEKNRKEYALYYLCGNTSHANYKLAWCSIGCIALISVLPTFLFILLFPSLSWHNGLVIPEVLLDWRSLVTTGIYCALMLLISTVVVFFWSWKKSPIQAIVEVQE